MVISPSMMRLGHGERESELWYKKKKRDADSDLGEAQSHQADEIGRH
jgi:hypothetical protein